jgi:hypothetical protein
MCFEISRMYLINDVYFHFSKSVKAELLNVHLAPHTAALAAKPSNSAMATVPPHMHLCSYTDALAASQELPLAPDDVGVTPTTPAIKWLTAQAPVPPPCHSTCRRCVACTRVPCVRVP